MMGMVIGIIAGGWLTGWNIIGVVVGGFIGMLIGETFHLPARRRRQRHFGGGGDGATVNENDFMYILIALLAKMTKADGVISRNEIKTVSMLFERMQIHGESLRLAQEIFRREKDSAANVESYIRRFRTATGNDPQLSEMLYYCLNQLARADGRITPAQRDILNIAERELNLDHAHTESVNKSDGRLTRQEAAEALDIPVDADEDTIKTAYRKKCNEMHPDKLVSKGLPKEMITFAETQLAKYNEAREVLLN